MRAGGETAPKHGAVLEPLAERPVPDTAGR